jgi:hypothetical protein
MDQKRTPKQDVADLVARRARKKQEKSMKLAIVRYRYLKSLSESAMDASEKKRLYELALASLTSSIDKERGGTTAL